MTHFIKIANPYYEAVNRGDKTFEVRQNDRNYKVGDYVVLYCINGEHKSEYAMRRITYVLYDTEYVKEGYVIFAIEPCSALSIIEEIASRECSVKE